MQVQEVKLIVIAQNFEEMNRHLEYCRDKGWVAICVHDLDVGLKLVASENPSFVLLSYDHANERIRDFGPIISRSFNIPVIALCERKTKVSSRILAQSGFRYLLFPPISGEGIYEKIQKIISSNKKSKVREVATPIKASRKSRPLFEIEEAPEDDSGHVTLSNSEKKESKTKIISGEKRRASNAKKDMGKTDFFKQIISPAFRKTFGRDGMIALKMNPQITMTEVISLRTEDFSGFLVFDIQVTEALRTKMINSFVKEIKTSCANFGVSLKLSDVISIDFNQISRQTFLGASHKFFMGEDMSRLSMMFAFLDEANLPKLTQDASGKTCIISHEDIAPEIPLEFSVYIHLPKNKKYYLFVRKGRKFTAKRVQRLKDMEHELFIYKNEEVDFYRYYFKTRFLVSILKPFLKPQALIKAG